jgi:phage repressor protein C with HTH and peptisase S24 domain
MKLSHGDIWAAIDAVAQKAGLSASGLARRAGLDPTTFNRSKRMSADGRLRWPSTESIAKVLEATGTNLDEFMGLLQEAGTQKPSRMIPLIGFAEASAQAAFDPQAQPTGEWWDGLPFPDADGSHVYALEMTGQEGGHRYRFGDVLIVSSNATLRRGDRIVIHCRDHRLFVGELVRQSARNLDFTCFADEALHSLPLSDIAFVSRILWAAQ